MLDRTLPPLRRARESAGLTADELGALLGLSAAEVDDLERNSEVIDSELLDRYATLFGLTPGELLAMEQPSATALLFRSMHAHGQAIAGLPALVLGDFVRCVRVAGRLRDALAEPQAASRWSDDIRAVPPAAYGSLHAQARQLARETREYLRLTIDQPIPSMRRLVADLGILAMFIEPEVAPMIAGAAVLDPYPAILVNLFGGARTWWSTRMTLAHELCHLLYDREALDPSHPRSFFLVSAVSSAEGQSLPWHLVDHYEAIEMRANAFAGDLLAPTEGVRRLVGNQDPTSLDVLRRVCEHYQIGLVTGINRLQNTFGFSKERRAELRARVDLAKATGKLPALLPESHPDVVEPGAQLRDHTFVDLVLRARARGLIDGVEAREHLRLRMSDPLPEHPELSPEQRRPLIDPETRANNAILRFLTRHAPPEFFVATNARRTAHGWEAVIRHWVTRDSSEEVGLLRLDSEFRVEEPVDWLVDQRR